MKHPPAFSFLSEGLPRDRDSGHPLPTYQGHIVVYSQGEGMLFRTWISGEGRHWQAIATWGPEQTPNA